MSRARRQAAVDSARGAAAFALEKLLTHGTYLADSVNEIASRGSLAPPARATALHLARGAARHLRVIEHVLSQVATFVPERVAPALRGILHVAAFELVWLDQTPAYAAVNEAVELAKRAGGPRAGAMVNAILRSAERAIESRVAPWEPEDCRLIRTGWSRACRFRACVLPARQAGDRGHFAYLAAASGADPSMLSAMTAAHGADAVEHIAWAWQATPPIVLRRNPLRANAWHFWRSLCAGDGALPAFDPDGVHMAGDPGEALNRLLTCGWAYAQDSTAAAAAREVGARPGERILDLCAAPGGKSVTMAIDLLDCGEILACDVDAERLARVDENVRRLGLTSIRTLLLPRGGAARDAIGAGRRFDAALVDVPCSNSGVFARRPEARLRFTDRSIRELAALQSRLLRAAAAHVRPGGRLVYSTCSIDARENDEVVRAFVEDSPAWTLHTASLTLPKWGAAPQDWADGGYFAHLRRGRD